MVAANLKAVVEVVGVPQATAKLRAFEAELEKAERASAVASLSAEVDNGAFSRFAGLVADAKKTSATAKLAAEVDGTGFRAFAADVAAAKAEAAKPIVQEMKVEVDQKSVAAARAEASMAAQQVNENWAQRLKASRFMGDADHSFYGSGSRKSAAAAAPSPQAITNDMFALRQWQLAHPNFWNVGPKENALTVGAATQALPNTQQQDSFIQEVAAQAAGSAAAKTVSQAKSPAEQTDNLAAITALTAAVSSLTEATKQGGGGNSGGFWGSLLGSAGGGGGGGLRNVLWGHGPGGGRGGMGRLLLGGGMLAGAGSVGAFAGFGAEHFLFTGLGLVGSAGAGALGGGLIAAGALGQMAVGSGSDMAVMKTTLTGVKELGSAYDAVGKAVQLYGAHSKQAAQAQAQLSLAMQEAGGGKGAHAELAVAKQAEALNEFWLKATQGARVAAAHIMEQVLGLAHAFIPKIAQAAQRNLTIVGQGLKPLFSWLKGPEGMGIWNQLENQFAHNLPIAMHAFDQGVQFVLKTVATASHYTGGFVEMVNRFFTKWNEPQNFSKWQTTIGHLVGDFHLWLNLIKTLGRDIFDLFANDAHTGNAIVKAITGMLEKVGEWERSVSGKAELHNIFQVHKEEILALLKIVPPLVVMFKSIYMTVAPPLVEAATEILNVIAKILTVLTKSSALFRWALGIGLIAAKLGLLKPLLGLMGLSFGKQVTETEALVASNAELTASLDALAAAYGDVAAAAGGAGAAQGIGAAGAAGAGGAAIGGSAGLLSRALASPFATAGAVAAGYFVAEFGAKAIESLTRSHFLEGQSVFTSLTHGFNTSGVAVVEARALHRLRAQEHISELRSGKVSSLGSIEKIAGEASAQISKGWEAGSSGWRKAAGESMLGVVAAIKAGMHQGVIGAEQGKREIAHILREYSLVTGSDPFHLAQAFTTTWAAAGRITGKGVHGVLNEIAKMPPAAREETATMMLEMVRRMERGGELAKGSFARLRSALVGDMGLAKTETLLAFSQMGSGLGRMVRRVKGLNLNLEESFTGLRGTVGDAISEVAGQTLSMLKSLGATHTPAFRLLTPLHGKGHRAFAPLEKATGGYITGGAPSGDSIPAMLERGEYVLNRNAVNAVGAHNLDALNFGAVSRFQAGGLAEPRIGGPAGALLSLGQADVHQVYQAAQRYLHLHSGRRGHGLAGLNVPTGPIEAMARAMVEHVWGRDQWAPFAEVVMRESGWNPHAQNPTSTAYGIAQNLNPSTYPPAGRPGSKAPILEQAKAQLAWMVNYIRGRYGTPAGAWAHEVGAGWYSRGGSPGAATISSAPGLIAREEERLGVPKSGAKRHRYAGRGTAARAVAWAMNNLGAGPKWGNPPGGWCGLFMGADMLAQGLGVPSGYAAADAWAGYGRPINRGSIYPGDIVDYGSRHVGMYVGSSHQINGNWGGRVALSSFPAPGIGPITAIRRPPYHGGVGAGTPGSIPLPKAITGTYSYHGARRHYRVGTSSLSFGSLPTTLHACQAEIAQRRKELADYRHALGQAIDAEERRAIQTNINALTHRISALLRQRARLVIAKKASVSPKQSAAIQAAERAYNIAQQYAEQVVGLEPAENPGSYLSSKEEPAYLSVLGAESNWRNSVLIAEASMAARIASFNRQIAKIEHLRHKDPAAFQRERFRLPALRAAIRKAQESWNPKTGTGTLEESLQNLQGVGGSHTPLASLPTEPQAGSFFGLIWQTQMAIRELGLKLKEGAGGAASESASARVALLEELLTRANQRTAAQAIYHKTFGEGIPYAGAYAAGGIVSALVGERGPELATFPAGTRIHSAPETATALAPSVIVNFYEGEQRAEVEVNGQKVEAIVNRKDRRGARTASRGLALAGKFGF